MKISNINNLDKLRKLVTVRDETINFVVGVKNNLTEQKYNTVTGVNMATLAVREAEKQLSEIERQIEVF